MINIKNKHLKQKIKNSLRTDYITEYQTKKDFKFRDGSFIKKGTSFIIENITNNYKYEIHFCDEEKNIYIPNNGVGDGYIFDIYEIKKLTKIN